MKNKLSYVLVLILFYFIFNFMDPNLTVLLKVIKWSGLFTLYSTRIQTFYNRILIKIYYY